MNRKGEGISGPAQLPESQGEQVRTLLSSWKEGPTIIASGSALKLESLKKIGFAHAVPAALPDEIEDEYLDRITDENNEGHLDERTAMYVAGIKVDALLAQGVPSDALVCGFDTIPMLTRRDDAREKKRIYLRKPKTLEEARTLLVDAFETMVKGRLYWEPYEKDIAISDPEELEQYIRTLRAGARESHVVVTTGQAVRLPGEGETVHDALASAYLAFDAVYALVHEPEQERLVQFSALADTILAGMGDRWRSVAGGIDYSDPQFWKILSIRNVMEDYFPVPEAPMFKGVPEQEFARFLESLAQEKVMQSAV